MTWCFFKSQNIKPSLLKRPAQTSLAGFSWSLSLVLVGESGVAGWFKRGFGRPAGPPA